MNEALAHVHNSGSGINDDYERTECSECGEEPRDGICRCSHIAVVCAWCESVISDGYGRIEWEGGDDSKCSHGMCSDCYAKEIAL